MDEENVQRDRLSYFASEMRILQSATGNFTGCFVKIVLELQNGVLPPSAFCEPCILRSNMAKEHHAS